MNFDVTYCGAVYRLANGVEYKYDGDFYGTAIEGQITQVVLTGYYVKSNRGSVGYQTTNGKFVLLSDGWEKVGTRAIADYSQAQAQALVNKIIANGKIIIRGNLLCAKYANRFTEEQRAQIRGLQSRLQARNAALQAEGLTKDVRTGYPEEYAELSPYLDALMKGEAIGVATWVVVVVAATVIAAMATAAYFAYKYYADESERDAKFSKELTATLVEKLTPEEYEQLLNETKGLLTKSKIKQLVSTTFNVSKLWIWALAGVAFYQVVIKNEKLL